MILESYVDEQANSNDKHAELLQDVFEELEFETDLFYLLLRLHHSRLQVVRDAGGFHTQNMGIMNFLPY